MLETIIIIEVVMWTIYLHNELMTDKKNIYGDLRLCIKCGMNADVVENNNDFCAECYFKSHTNTTLEEYEKKNIEIDIERERINYKKDKK
jgi:hypothetical protein